MTFLGLALVALMILVGLLNGWAMLNLRRRLKEAYPSEWERLGNPHEFSMNSTVREFRWAKFVLLREYARYGDRQVSLWGDVMLASAIAGVGLVIAWAVILRGPLVF